MSACMCSTCCHWDANVNRCWSSIHSDICYDTNCVAPVGTNPNVVEPPRPEPIAPPPNNGGVGTSKKFVSTKVIEAQIKFN